MTPYLHIGWLPDESLVDEYLQAVKSVPGVLETAAYRREERSEDMRELGASLARLDNARMLETPAQAWVLIELDSLAAAASIGELLGLPEGSESHPIAEHVLNQSIMHEINRIEGPEDGCGRSFAPAHQFGVLSVNSLDAEWQLHLWYERLRLIEVATIPGMIRTRRYSVVAGQAKWGILYEFPSIQARLDGFEALTESKVLDDSHPNAALRRYTVHTPGAPFIGSRID